MGLISDRKTKARKEKAAAAAAEQLGLGPHHHHHHYHHAGKGYLNHHPLRPHSHAAPGSNNPYNVPNNVPKYPPGYYTTPVHSHSKGKNKQQQYDNNNLKQHQHSNAPAHYGSQMLHPSSANGKFHQSNMHPRGYQTWVAPQRKQPSLGQLVRLRELLHQNG